MMGIRDFLYRLSHWEYWPFWAIYYPLFPFWLYFSVRARSFFFFNAVNPSIANGGMAMESKKAIYDLMPGDHIPKTLLIKTSDPSLEVVQKVEEAGFQPPYIAKPDIGLKGLGVERIGSHQDLLTYQQNLEADFLVQELVEHPMELGVFFVRTPGNKNGMVTGIVQKEFLSITGNGTETFGELIEKQPRSRLQRHILARRFQDSWGEVLPKGENRVLVPFGSHTRGAKFLDKSHLISQELETTLNKICSTIKGFHFGRLDILCASIEDLSKGTNFKVIEVNGAGSEPTHIYDPKHSLFFAWKEILRHWRLLYRIARYNKKQGHNYLGYQDGREMLKKNKALEARLKLL